MAKILQKVSEDSIFVVNLVLIFVEIFPHNRTYDQINRYERTEEYMNVNLKFDTNDCV